MIFRRKNHKLPKFPPTVIPAFESICERLSPQDIRSFKPHIENKIVELREKGKENDRVNVPLGEEIAKRCLYLLAHCDEFTDAQRALIVGAIRYFAITEDAVDEEMFASGLDDDAKIVNYVLEELGIEDQYLDLI